MGHWSGEAGQTIMCWGTGYQSGDADRPRCGALIRRGRSGHHVLGGGVPVRRGQQATMCWGGGAPIRRGWSDEASQTWPPYAGGWCTGQATMCWEGGELVRRCRQATMCWGSGVPIRQGWSGQHVLGAWCASQARLAGHHVLGR